MDKDHINMYNDALFKSFAKSIEARPIMARFLNALTGIPKVDLINAEYIGGEMPIEVVNEKRKTSDIIVKIGNNNAIIVEMNQSYHSRLFRKNTFYAFKYSTYHNVVGSEDDFGVMLINIDKFNYFKTDLPILHFKIRDEEGHIENELYNSIHIVVDNFSNTKYNIDKEIEKFVLLLNQTNLKELKTTFKGDEDYMAGYVKLEDMLRDDVDKIGLLYDYDEEMADRLQGSIEYGIQQGIEQGIEQGSLNKQKEIVLTMLEKNYSLDEISSITGLSIDDINNIKGQ